MSMEINLLGLISASTAFLGIWLGHVGVRMIERVSPNIWLPVLIALALGLGLEYWSLATENVYLSAATGILGITLLWDALEFSRQRKRVAKGHAPANPQNPRHKELLVSGKGTTLDLLNRDPVSRRVDAKEANQLVSRNN